MMRRLNPNAQSLMMQKSLFSSWKLTMRNLLPMCSHLTNSTTPFLNSSKYFARNVGNSSTRYRRKRPF
uniref:Uncharacterized protein n=1 Tax=Arundo donax TaxID=35708 RepID=A0A0A9GFS8_ARUDO